ncbi:unnamed protein product [Moneuplotes crassus]|uniref:Uncharacterized protein n=1 Tax=Euplotes crassus TaxID=5936 RepID=A0AAD1Y083_EUPCR|nr:unnamed protein product [Moneuplotes crassus]
MSESALITNNPAPHNFLFVLPMILASISPSPLTSQWATATNFPSSRNNWFAVAESPSHTVTAFHRTITNSLSILSSINFTWPLVLSRVHSSKIAISQEEFLGIFGSKFASLIS